MGKEINLSSGGWENKNLVGGESTGGIFPGGEEGGMSKFLVGDGDSLITPAGKSQIPYGCNSLSSTISAKYSLLYLKLNKS